MSDDINWGKKKEKGEEEISKVGRKRAFINFKSHLGTLCNWALWASDISRIPKSWNLHHRRG